MQEKLLYRTIFIFLAVILLCSDCHAAYVGNPARAFASKEKKLFSFLVEGVTDIIYDRKAKAQSSETKIDFHGAQAGIICKDRGMIYGGAGIARVVEEYMVILDKIKWESDYGFTWVVGGELKVYEKELKNFFNSILLFGLDIQYRNTKLDTDTVIINSVKYSISEPGFSQHSMEYNDWHAAAAAALDTEFLSPYAGVKYSDFESCVRFIKNGVWYEKNNAEADNNIGVFAGIDVKFADSLSARVEASFIDEESISGSLSWQW